MAGWPAFGGDRRQPARTDPGERLIQRFVIAGYAVHLPEPVPHPGATGSPAAMQEYRRVSERPLLRIRPESWTVRVLLLVKKRQMCHRTDRIFLLPQP